MDEPENVTAIPHPEEIKAEASARFGDRAAFKASFRITPAGLIATGILVAAVLIPTFCFAASQRRKPPTRALF